MERKGWARWSCIAAVAIVLTVVAGCGSDNAESDSGASGSTDESYKFAYANILDASPLLKEVGDQIVKEGPKVGIEVSRYDNNNDAAKAIENARLIALEKPDVAIDWNVVEGVGTSIGEIFKRANLPCVAVNTPIPGCPFFNLVNKRVGVDAAKVMVPLAKEKGWTADNTTVIMLMIGGAGDEINAGSRNFYENVAKEMGMDPVTAAEISDKTTKIGRHGLQLDGKASIEASHATMKTTLQALPKERNLMVFAANDDSALGAWRAIENAGREDSVLLASSGANAAAIEQLRTNPSWVAENSLFFEYWSEYLLAMGVAVKRGMETPPQTFSPQLMLTKENIDEYYEGTEPKKAPPLHPDNAYLEETGILEKLGITG